MGHLAQPSSTQAHPVRRTHSGWRLVPVVLGTAAVLAGCGAGGHRASRVAVSSAHEHTAVSHRAARVAVSSAHEHTAVSSHHGSRVAVSSAHKHSPISQTAATGQAASPASADAAPGNLVPGGGAPTGAASGAHVAVGRSSAKRSGSDVRTATPRPGEMIRIITGTRTAQIGTLAERTSVFLDWTASEAPIQIFTSQGNLLLSSHARHGRIRLAEGRYRGLRVASPGAWTLRLHAAV
jgi:hypothetical protein